MVKLINKKGFMELPFSWVFALIVGVTIIFLAIYFSIKLIDIEGTRQTAETSNDIGIILDPLETGFEESKTVNLDLGIESELDNICDIYGEFGVQKIATTQKIFGEEKGGDIEVVFYNKYIFSDDKILGRTFYIFTKKFEFPFKISDLIFIIPTEKQFCFVNAPSEIINLTKDLNLENIKSVTGISLCSEQSEKVCFRRVNGCDTVVDINLKITTKEDKRLYFDGEALMFASIFSNPNIYECQIKRLAKRASSLAQLYEEKKNFIATKNCRSLADLNLLITSLDNLNSSTDLTRASIIKDDIENKNKYAQCQLW
jgi:hypothetical protein